MAGSLNDRFSEANGLRNHPRRGQMEIVEFSSLLTCLGDRSKFRIVARLSPPPGGILQTIDPIFEKAVYSKRVGALLIKRGNSLVTIYSSGIVTMTRLSSEDHARPILQEIIGQINSALENGDPTKMGPISKAGRHIDPMELNDYLPHSNCGQCGAKSCFYFATMLAYSEAALEKCTPLKETRYSANREIVERLISANPGDHP